MSKHAVAGLMKDLCTELGQHGIRVNCISPCAVVTPLVTNAFAVEKKAMEKVLYSSANSKGVVPQAEDVAEAAVFFSSDESKYVSGLNLTVDEGYSTTNVSFTKLLKNLLSSAKICVPKDDPI
ncbi:secoisolariciresinol dehydrogenase-like [Melia azedarach]|uniref:Secoisolariciresinol dehydrogenase-like n=1 Tax=Melia azedarach TaxID=155640 RepID=A0ACC1X3Q9_MELAZ|nr:secoisolariciresinol dehydrogenase-like [Melia azedarach]